MFVKIYDKKGMLAIQPITIEKKENKVVMSSLEETIKFGSDGFIGRFGIEYLTFNYDYLMCNGECYNATPEGYQEFLENVVDKL